MFFVADDSFPAFFLQSCALYFERQLGSLCADSHPMGVCSLPLTDHAETQIEEALRDFKRSLEATWSTTVNRASRSASDIAVDRWGGSAPASAGWNDVKRKATGAEGMRAMNPAGTTGTHAEDASWRVRNPAAVDYTRPPER